MKAWISGIALLAATAPALAYQGFGDPSINQREYRLEQRIEQGVRSGELTRNEYRRLRFELRDIERNKQWFMADGRLTASERAQLHARLDALSREIYRERHDFSARTGSYNGYYADRRF